MFIKIHYLNIFLKGKFDNLSIKLFDRNHNDKNK
jgi:hypothetical protein